METLQQSINAARSPLATNQVETTESLSQFATDRERTIKAQSQLVLSVFHGADLFGMAFESVGFCVVRASEKELGFDVRNFHPLPDKFDGIIGGSPCQDFSMANRNHRTLTGYGAEMVKEFCRLVVEARPQWFVLENVPQVPDISIDGYSIQRINLNSKNFGSGQNRARCFQFGSLDNRVLQIPEHLRLSGKVQRSPSRLEKACLASEGKKKDRRKFSDFCKLQGLPENFKLPMLTKTMNYQVVGNGVPLNLGRAVALGVVNSIIIQPGKVALCECNCGSFLKGKQRFASKACQKRMERKKNRAKAQNS